MRYFIDGKNIIATEGVLDLPEITEEEYKERLKKFDERKELNISRHEMWKKKRPLTSEEVATLFIKQKINTIEVSDADALRMKSYYPEWSDLIGKVVDIGFKFQHNGDLYKVLQLNHTFQSNWLPGVGTESLYTRIDETHDGSLGDPIPYDGNMTLVNGLYYVQDGYIYQCTRDTGNPVYNPLKDLIGLYVVIL